MPLNIAKLKQQFINLFNNKKPWLAQVCDFCKQFGYMSFGSCKVKLAEKLAETCIVIPSSFSDLANLIEQTRQKYPVKHPSNVKLPKIPGLTY